MATLYYQIVALNELGESVATTGSYDPVAPVAGSVTESGGATLSVGAIADGQTLKRSGTSIVGYTPGLTARSVSTNDSAVAGDDVLFITNTVTITLMTGAGRVRPLIIKNVGTGTVTVAAAGAETVDGGASIQLLPTDRCTLLPRTSSAWETIS